MVPIQLAYGALDEPALGSWARHGGVVILYASKFETSMEDQRKFDRLDLTIVSDGKLIRRFNAERIGSYARQ